MRKPVFCYLLLCSLHIPLVHAAPVGIGVHGGTSGFGVNVHYKINEYLAIKAAISQLHVDYETTQDYIEYVGHFSLKNVQLGVEYYPTAKNFKLALAGFQNSNYVDVDALPDYAGEIIINGKAYTARDIASLNAKMYWPKNGIYTGFGWSSDRLNKKGFLLNIDAGVFLTQAPKIYFTALCVSDLQPTCDDLLADAEDEKRKLEEDVKILKIWPLFQLGLTYQF